MKEYKGDLKGFPQEVVEKMLQRQEEQGNPRNVRVFENNIYYGKSDRGFDWCETPEDFDFWDEVISFKNFNLFFEEYLKENNSMYYEFQKSSLVEFYNSVDCSTIKTEIIKILKENPLKSDIDLIQVSADLIQRFFKEASKPQLKKAQEILRLEPPMQEIDWEEWKLSFYEAPAHETFIKEFVIKQKIYHFANYYKNKMTDTETNIFYGIFKGHEDLGVSYNIKPSRCSLGIGFRSRTLTKKVIEIFGEDLKKYVFKDPVII